MNVTRIQEIVSRLDRALAQHPHRRPADARAWIHGDDMTKSTTLTIRVSPDELVAIDRYAEDLTSGSPVKVTRSEAARVALLRGIAAPQEWRLLAQTDAGPVERTFATRDALQRAWIDLARSNGTRSITCHRDREELTDLRYDREVES